MSAGSSSRKLRTHILNHTRSRESKLEVGKFIYFQRVRVSFLKRHGPWEVNHAPTDNLKPKSLEKTQYWLDSKEERWL